MPSPAGSRSIDDWQVDLGRQVSELRLRSGRTQAELAREANVSVSAIHALEHGTGSSLATLISVLRVLDRADWLDDLAPPATISPLAMLRERQRIESQRPRRAARQRAR